MNAHSSRYMRGWYDDLLHEDNPLGKLKFVLVHGFTPNPAIYELLTGRNAHDDNAKETTTPTSN